MKALLVACGTIAVALGVIGIFVPLMPTTVFLLLAAACYARSSDRFYQRLIENRWLGSYIRNSREGRGMTRRQKMSTLAMLWVGIGASAIWSVDALWIRCSSWPSPSASRSTSAVSRSRARSQPDAG